MESCDCDTSQTYLSSIIFLHMLCNENLFSFKISHHTYHLLYSFHLRIGRRMNLLNKIIKVMNDIVVISYNSLIYLIAMAQNYISLLPNTCIIHFLHLLTHTCLLTSLLVSFSSFHSSTSSSHPTHVAAHRQR